ncbi:MAG: hypothetical protein JRG96_20800 [Deltaproteobacteria bacterium]|nr:hypothetical protein [Deltaproteobacteria bacterium]
MRGSRRLAAALVALALLPPLSGCGKYGKPVRKSSTFSAESAAQTTGGFGEWPASATGRAQDAQEKKPGDR